ncbi:MAG: DUF2283 domain-containing protein [Candidatus Lokiarchaeota archaeon]|nr:DUF2283 domain-containing protein [Candidatus Lokiarchaeota archaeon]
MEGIFHLLIDFSFDKVADVLYIKFSEEKIAESDQISSGIIVDYSKGCTFSTVKKSDTSLFCYQFRFVY